MYRKNAVSGEKNLDSWLYCAANLPAQIEKERTEKRIYLGFLNSDIDVAEDHYSGNTKIYYYSNEDGKFYTYINHWDGGNMMAGFCTPPEVVPFEEIMSELESKKELSLPLIQQEEMDRFLEAYDQILKELKKLNRPKDCKI